MTWPKVNHLMNHLNEKLALSICLDLKMKMVEYV